MKSIESLTLIDMLAETKDTVPNSVAIRYNDWYLSYKELFACVGAVKDLLIKSSIVPGDIIIVPSIHKPETVIAILGVIANGCTYLPLDLNWPSERIRRVLDESNPRAYICSKGKEFDLADKYVKQIEKKILCININIDELLNTKNTHKFETEEKPDTITYILYTSGSSGYPKGVKHRCESVRNLINWSKQQFKHLKPLVAGITRFTFDLSVLDLFTALATGGEYQIISDADLNNIARLIRRIYIYKSNIIQTVPSILIRMIGFLSCVELDDARLLANHIRVTIMAGEQLYMSLVSEWFTYADQKCVVYNMYGPTETIHVTSNIVTRGDLTDFNAIVPLGKALPNISIKLVDQSENIVLATGIGEIHIGGIAVAEGYVTNRNENVRSGFYSKVGDIEKEYYRWYRTGDIAERIDDGSMIFKGRSDDQLKINGCRIHLSEIENAALCVHCVTQAVVVVGGSENDLILVVATDVRNDQTDQLISNAIAKRIPKYAHPKKIIKQSYLPTTLNGKIDREEIKNKVRRDEYTNRTRVRLTADRWKFVLNEKRNATQEHPQATIVLRKCIERKVLEKELSVLVQSELLLRLKGKSDLGNTALVVDESTEEYRNKAIKYFSETDKTTKFRNLVLELGKEPLYFASWPNFRIGCANLKNGNGVLSLRCHHATASGSKVLQWLGQLTRAAIGSQSTDDHKNVAFCWDESSQGKDWGLSIKSGTCLLNSDTRGWIHFPRNVFNDIKSSSEKAGLTVQAFMLAIFGKVISKKSEKIFVDTPLFRKVNSSDGINIVDEILPLSAKMHTAEVPLSSSDFRKYKLWAKTVSYKTEAVDEQNVPAQYLWNFTPIESFLKIDNLIEAIVPLDLYEQLPSLAVSRELSILAQTYRSEAFIVIRSKERKMISKFTERYIEELLLCVKS